MFNLSRPMPEPHQTVIMPTQLPTDDEIVAFCKGQRALGNQSNTYGTPLEMLPLPLSNAQVSSPV